MSRDGLFMFRQRRGPHRICVCASAGCSVIAERGTTSAGVVASTPSDAVRVVVVVGVKAWRRVVGLRLKMVSARAGVAVGRRVGRAEKDL